MFVGLRFNTAAYFNFFLKLEYVLLRCLTSTKLAGLGNILVQRVFTDVYGNINVRILFNDINGGDDNVDDEIMDGLIVYLVRTYCCMRGEYFAAILRQQTSEVCGKGCGPHWLFC